MNASRRVCGILHVDPHAEGLSALSFMGEMTAAGTEEPDGKRR